MKALKDFAAAHGKRPEELFDTTPGSMVFNAPGQSNPCYPTPGVGQMAELEKLKESNARLATNGIAIAGNYITYGDGIGFMENGAESAYNAVPLILPERTATRSALRAQQQSAQRGSGMTV